MSRHMRQVSKKRQAEQDERRAVVDTVRRRDNWKCQARDRGAPGKCFGALDPHEVIPRSAWRGGYLVADNVIMVCREHHDWIGENPDEAHALGLHGYSWEVTK